MRRILIFILCCFLLTTAVFASGSVTDLQSNTSVSSNGSCRISLSFQLSLTQAQEGLRFPLPGDARDISLNGNATRTTRSDGLRWVDISPAVYGAGSYTVNLNYSLPDRVSAEKSGLVLQLPLLSGFGFPIERMEFSIQLPGEIQETPTFISTYHPESVESILDYTVTGATISGAFHQGLKDHETLTMNLPVSNAMFPQTIVKRWSLSSGDLARYVLTVLAALYWVIFLRTGLPRRIRRVQAPDGLSAGALGCGLVGQGVDFTMMVISWAQMGYLSIQIDRNRRVLLRKRMDMGNERNEFEVRCFKTLFGGRRTVDGSAEHYARLGRKAAKTILGARSYYRKGSGNPNIFRCLSAGIGLFAGVSMAAAFTVDTQWQIALSLVLGILGAVVSWLIQAGCRCFGLRHRQDLYVALGAGILWLVLSNLAGEWNVAVYVLVSQAVAGFAGAYGGRRTEMGIQTRGEILGLRYYLKSITAGKAQSISRKNPEHYFSMAPYALALGVDRGYARQFGEQKLPPCPYLSVGSDAPMTAREWNQHFRQVMRVLDARQHRFALQKLFRR